MDYRKLNEITEPVFYPIPKMHNFFDDLRGLHWFNKIDLNMGYYQIHVEESDIPKTAFVIANETYGFLRMPFGLSNAPRTLQRVMNRLFEDMDFVKVYLDDILVHSQTKVIHLEHLQKVFTRLKEAGASINFDKSHFMKQSVTYFGNNISGDGIKPDLSRVGIYNNFYPKNIKQLQRIIGFINWSRPYVRNLLYHLSPITNKLQKEKSFVWNQEDQILVNKIFQQIKKQTLLNYPDYEKPLKLEVDANEISCGAVLYQKDKVLGIYSAKFNNTESNYTIVEKETLAGVKGIEHFKPIIFNSKIIIYTDNANILAKKSLTKRINRWKLVL